MTQEELVAVYEQYVGVSFTVPMIALGCFFFMLFFIYLIVKDEVGRFKSNWWLYSTTTIFGICVIVLVVFAVRVMFTGDEINEMDSDYKMVEEQFILPYFNSLEPIIYDELVLTERIGHTAGKASRIYSYNAIGGQRQGKASSDSKLQHEFDEYFRIRELTYHESTKGYSYVEYRQFPFKLDNNYNPDFGEYVAYFTVEDMAALLDADTSPITMEKNFAKKVEDYRMSQKLNVNKEGVE
ncbi:hypothetical protein ABD91_26170 [Lysinibacillus sphaericus]|uniref:hypothetical protein n=1 Tax=Lysinibacillus sphaericus TaxID=1421 RepID=UPI0018CFB4C5|nr:hypothetical protein [Lysinibacillus sphaericus]MBG9694219.1 hypothetical protein [Lysinibacillus sphaericus]